MASQYDLTIIGGGIVGLATALKILEDYPRTKLLILEKEPQLARHQTGNNSGVIHSGLYYRPGSLKARSCVAGRKALIEFCNENSVPYELCGKVVVATSEEELPRLDELHRRGALQCISSAPCGSLQGQDLAVFRRGVARKPLLMAPLRRL